MTIVENTSDRLRILEDTSRYGYYGFSRLSIAWFFCPFFLLYIWFKQSPKESIFWIVTIPLVVTSLISFTVWFWKLEIELTEERMHIKERLLWRKNREEEIPLQSIKEVLIRRRWPVYKLLLALQPSKERVIALGLFETTFLKGVAPINDFLKKHRT